MLGILAIQNPWEESTDTGTALAAAWARGTFHERSGLVFRSY